MSDEILVLIPAFNEGSRIEAVIRGAQKHLKVLVVDDGSVDGTCDVARKAGAQVLRQDPNQGKGAALKAGFRHALESGCQAAVTLDADGQHDPAEIPKFIDTFNTNSSDLLIGERDFHSMPLVRRIANSSGRVLFSWALGQPVRDNQSGYRLISRRLMEAMLESEVGGFEFEVDMIVTCVQRRYRLDGVPIRTIYSNQGSHISPLKHVLGFFALVWRTRRAMHKRGKILTG